MAIHVHNADKEYRLRIQIAKFKFRQYLLRANSPNLMLSHYTVSHIQSPFREENLPIPPSLLNLHLYPLNISPPYGHALRGKIIITNR